jgi:NifU-like protein
MGLAVMTISFPWMRYSKKLTIKIDQLRNTGFFTLEEAVARTLRLVEGVEGTLKEGNVVHFYWLVDPDDGIIVDAKYQAFGQPSILGAAEGASELLVGKNYDQASRITADLIDKHLRDDSETPAFPREAYTHLNIILGAIQNAAEKCTDIPFAATYNAPPVPMQIEGVLEGGYPGWSDLPLGQKIAVIEDVLDREIRPYIALDAGGVEVLSLINDRELLIKYQGSCTSCYSSVGATLSAIQGMLRAKVHPDIVVIPENISF